jgi:nicotinamidase-related amidase
VQNGVVAGTHERDAVVANVGSLVEKARRERIPVVWVQHSDEQLVRESDDWRIVPELAPGGAEPLVEKNYGDSFEATALEAVLSGLGVGRLVVVGAQTNLYWAYQTAPGKTAGTVETRYVSFDDAS